MQVDSANTCLWARGIDWLLRRSDKADVACSNDTVSSTASESHVGPTMSFFQNDPERLPRISVQIALTMNAESVEAAKNDEGS